MERKPGPFRAADGRFAPRPLRWWQKLALKVLARVVAK